MKNREVASQTQRIKSLIESTSNACGNNLEIQSHWARYLCIVISGLLENSIKEIFSEYAKKQVSQPVANFVNAKLSQIRNPKAEIFLQTASAFNPQWQEELKNFMQEEGRDDAINSIINNRHLIAHGKDKQSGVTISQVKEWLKKSIEVLEFIDELCQE